MLNTLVGANLINYSFIEYPLSFFYRKFPQIYSKWQIEQKKLTNPLQVSKKMVYLCHDDYSKRIDQPY